MKDRLRKFLTQEGVSPSQFADEIGVQRSAISHILSGRNYPSYEIIVKILNRYKRLSPDWLLLGTGSMYRPENKSYIANNPVSDPNNTSEIAKTFAENDVSPELKPTEEHSFTSSSEKPSSLPPLSTTVNKHISGIVILYDDRTFEIYHQRD